MILIDGFHKDCPTATILEVINIFNNNRNIKIDIPHTTEKQILPGLQFYNQQRTFQHHIQAHLQSALQFIGWQHQKSSSCILQSRSG